MAKTNIHKEDFLNIISANYRMVVDMDPNGKSYYIIDAGASESVFSSHYDDQQKLHSEGNYIEMSPILS